MLLAQTLQCSRPGSRSGPVLYSVSRSINLIPNPKSSISKLFTAWKPNDLESYTGLETDRHRRQDLFAKLTTEEYNDTIEVLIELDKNYVFPKLKDLTKDNDISVMAIANQLGMHVCPWLQPDSMQEAKNTPLNSRPSIHTVLSTFPVIPDHPTDYAATPVSPIITGDRENAASMAVLTARQRATLTHFEEALCELSTTYQVHLTHWASESKHDLSVESLGKETVCEYRKRFTDSVGWAALMQLVVTYFGADSLPHAAVNCYVLTSVVSTFLVIPLTES